MTLTAQHVRASAAIPALFPAVHVDAAPGAGWYVDTLARQNGVPGRRPVPYIFVRPDSPTAIGALAAQVFAERYRGRVRFGRPELAVLGRLLEGDFDPAHGELLSYLFFDPDFFAELVTLGRRDADRWLATAHDDGPWQLGPE